MYISSRPIQRYKNRVTEKRSYKVIHLWAICSPLPFLCLSDCAETSLAHFPTLREGKMEKDVGKCLNRLKNIMYDVRSFLLQGNLLGQCRLKGLCYKPNSFKKFIYNVTLVVKLRQRPIQPGLRCVTPQGVFTLDSR